MMLAAPPATWEFEAICDNICESSDMADWPLEKRHRIFGHHWEKPSCESHPDFVRPWSR
jgi:hypothetical protein